MKMKFRRAILTLLTFCPITSVSFAAANAKGKERNKTELNQLFKANAKAAKDGSKKGGDREIESNDSQA